MTKDKIIEMAREAGISNYTDYRLESFANRIEHIAAQKEREACAKVCDDIEMKNTRHGPADCAAAIRARKP